MSSIAELRTEAQSKGKELVEKWNQLQAECRSIEKELDMVAKYHDQIEILQKYFK